jgi:hypothetical protein
MDRENVGQNPIEWKGILGILEWENVGEIDSRRYRE